jgi:hypothetical protein
VMPCSDTVAYHCFGGSFIFIFRVFENRIVVIVLTDPLLYFCFNIRYDVCDRTWGFFNIRLPGLTTRHLGQYSDTHLKMVVNPVSETQTVGIVQHDINIIKYTLLSESRDSSAVIALGYGLDDRCSRVRFPAAAGNFSLHRIQNGSGAHPASYPMGTRGCFLGGKAARA